MKQSLPPSLHLPSSISAAVSVLWSCSCSLTSSHCSHFPSEGGKKSLQTLFICSHTPSPLSFAELLVLHFQETLLWNGTYSSRRKLLSCGRNQKGKFFVVCFEQAPLLHFIGPPVCFLHQPPLPQSIRQQERLPHHAAPQHHVAKRRQRPLSCVITSDITSCNWDVCRGEIPRVLCCQKS